MTRFGTAILMLTLAGCSVSVDVGKKKKPPAPVTPPVSAVPVTTAVSIPPSAPLVAQGTTTVAYTADTQGTLYVFVRADRSIPFVSDFETGDAFVLTAGAAQTTYTVTRRSTGASAGSLPVSPAGYELYYLRKTPLNVTTQPTTTTSMTAPAADRWLRRRDAVCLAF